MPSQGNRISNLTQKSRKKVVVPSSAFKLNTHGCCGMGYTAILWIVPLTVIIVMEIGLVQFCGLCKFFLSVSRSLKCGCPAHPKKCIANICNTWNTSHRNICRQGDEVTRSELVNVVGTQFK